jgi:hypothetical protein
MRECVKPLYSQTGHNDDVTRRTRIAFRIVKAIRTHTVVTFDMSSYLGPGS